MTTAPPTPPEDMCGCGDPFGPHLFVAEGESPLDGGRFYCQWYPECPCTGTWSTNAPEELKAQYRTTGENG